MANNYPWYVVVAGGQILQGDLLMNCPIPSLESLPFPIPDDHVFPVKEWDLVVITQSCDLEEKKTNQVLLCPHWSLEAGAESNLQLKGKDKQTLIAKGRTPRYLMLERCEIGGQAMAHRIVDFGLALSLPVEYVTRFAVGVGDRLRLCPPYREHLSQGYARYFMRVGLPHPIVL